MPCATSGWDRTFLRLSSLVAEPICAAFGLLRYRLAAPLDPETFEHCSSLAAEIGVRTAIVLAGAVCCAALPVFLALGVLHKVFSAIGFSLQTGGYTSIRGNAPEKQLSSRVKVLTWNVCGPGGGMPLDHGGVIGWRGRLDSIVRKLEEEDADVVVLQEIYDAALGEALVDRLQGRYAHFYTHLGPNVLGSSSGLMVLTKCAVDKFSFTSFRTNDWTINRGFAEIILKDAPLRIIGTHLTHGEEPQCQAIRDREIDQIIEHASPLPTVLTGDLNTDRNLPESEHLSSLFEHAYTGEEATRTNRLVAQWNPCIKERDKEAIDYISGMGVSFEECHLVEAFDSSYNTKTALSDHHGVAATIILPQEGRGTPGAASHA